MRPESRADRFGSVDPGREPPLAFDEDRAPDRRRVSIRWLTGTILTGLFGATLMGGAVYAALDGEYSFARAPLAAPVPARDGTATSDSGSNAGRKSDRILTQTDTVAAHQVIRVSTTTKVGEKDVIKVKPFARVMANLALVAGDLADKVPKYNPLQIIAAANPEPAAVSALVEDDGEVSVATRDLAGVKVEADAGLTLTDEQIRGLVREQASFEASAVSITIPPQLLALGVSDTGLSSVAIPYGVEGVDTASALEVSIVPENVTDVGKTSTTTGGGSSERTITVQQAGTLAALLKTLGAGDEDGLAIGKLLGDAASLNEGQRVRVLVEPMPDDKNRVRPVRVSVYNADQHLGTVALSDNGDYVTVADPDTTEVANADTDDGGGDRVGGIRLYDSIYETALKQQVPSDLIDALMRIYAYDVDLSRRTRPGDNFEVFYEQDESGKPLGDILYTSLSIDGDMKRYYRFVSPDDGQVDYYDEQGRSARKFLMRKPINGGEMRSTFGLRRHPILGYYKMHTGVDWADKVGTPILATGNGTIVKAGWQNGYGRHIEIQHANGYLTTYSHMQGFARGIEPGVKVKLGQVIGFLGSSGLSTGPHCHYEVKINGNFVDPMRIKLPQGRELSGDLLAEFRQERARLDAMMNKAPVAEAASATKGT